MVVPPTIFGTIGVKVSPYPIPYTHVLSKKSGDFASWTIVKSFTFSQADRPSDHVRPMVPLSPQQCYRFPMPMSQSVTNFSLM